MEEKQQKSLGFFISNTANLLNSTINKELNAYEIAIEQRAILEIIASKKEIKQTQLGNILTKDKTTISRTLKTLENKNYIIKEKIDNKTYIIKLSKQGSEVLEKTKNIVNDFRKKILLEFTKEEIENLYNSLEKINRIVKERKD